MKKDCVVFLTPEEIEAINNDSNYRTVNIKLPCGTGTGKRMSDLFMNYSINDMQNLIAEVETNGRNDYARSLCNEALERQGNTPCF